MMTSTKIAAFQKSGLFTGLSDTDLTQAVEALAAEKVELNAGQTLFKKGDAGGCFWVVESGAIGIQSQSKHRLAQTEGAVTGLQGIFDQDAKRRASMQALEPAVLWKVNANALQNLAVASERTLWANICRILSQKLRNCRIKGQSLRQQLKG
ncbi:cyclic nucleotide-binding domain-containing protein [Magnetococcales bacterium HHB-1]